MRPTLPALLGAALCVAATLAAVPAASQPDGGSALPLESRSLVLNPEDRAQQRVGRLVWRGGLALSSPASAFGGLSDLLLDGTGTRLAAISDNGRWLTATLTYDAAGHLSGIEGARLGHLKGDDGAPLSRGRDRDAEALARFPDGSLVVGYERNHRFRRLPAQNSFAARPRPFPAPRALAGAALNAGVEALVALNDGRLLAFTEGQRYGDNTAAYLWEGEGGGSGNWARLALKPSGLFQPTGATLLPDGDVLLLERRFTLLGGLGIRLSRIPLETIQAGAVLESAEIAELRPPLTLDNFEGVAVHQTAAGAIRLTLLADDNFNALQRSLIVQFDLQPER